MNLKQRLEYLKDDVENIRKLDVLLQTSGNEPELGKIRFNDIKQIGEDLNKIKYEIDNIISISDELFGEDLDRLNSTTLVQLELSIKFKFNYSLADQISLLQEIQVELNDINSVRVVEFFSDRIILESNYDEAERILIAQNSGKFNSCDITDFRVNKIESVEKQDETYQLFKEVQIEIKQNLIRDTEKAIMKLQKAVIARAACYDDFVQSSNRYYRSKDLRIKGLISFSEYNQEMTAIAQAILHLINSLSSDDIDRKLLLPRWKSGCSAIIPQ